MDANWPGSGGSRVPANGRDYPFAEVAVTCRSSWRRFEGECHAFGALKPGYGRVQAIRDWVNGHVRFTSHSSNTNTSALDTLIDQVGVCRDFAHLMIALCRALNIPARYATGTDYGSNPALGPPISRPMSRCTWGTVGTSSIRQAPRSRWASCALAPGVTRPTWLSPPCSAASGRIGRPFGRWPSRTMRKAWCDRITASTRCRRTAARHPRRAAELPDQFSQLDAISYCGVMGKGAASSHAPDIRRGRVALSRSGLPTQQTVVLFLDHDMALQDGRASTASQEQRTGRPTGHYSAIHQHSGSAGLVSYRRPA